MNAWSLYAARTDMHGSSVREAAMRREQGYLRRKLPESLSYHEVIVGGEPRQMAVINSDDLNKKTLCSMPGEDIRHGAIVDWMDNHWLVIEKDYNTELYTRAIMQQCNYLLRWVDDRDNVIERWCIIEDGTKLLKDSLARWKRCVKTPPLIAGTPLEPCHQNGEMKYAHTATVRKRRGLGNQQPSLEKRRVQRLSHARVGTSVAEIGSPKPQCVAW